MARLEKHFNIDADEEEDLQADQIESTQKVYTKSSGVAEINSRHSAKYNSLIKKDKSVKTSNRDDILAGRETELINVGEDLDVGKKPAIEPEDTAGLTPDDSLPFDSN